MKYVFMAGIAAAALASSSAWAFQDSDWPKTPKEAKAFVQSIPSDAWTKIIASSLQLNFFDGKPIVAVFNPFDEALTSVVCDSKWSLVGNSAYNKSKGAPVQVPAHTVTFIPTDGFEGYCRTSIVGLTESGSSHKGQLQIPGDFTHSTAIYFSPKE